MIVLGLTGSIGMGKSTIAGNFKRLGIPIHDADETVHGLLKPNGEAFLPIKEMFPEAVKKGAIDRDIIAAKVFGDEDSLTRIEQILHPLVQVRERKFLGWCAREGKRQVVLDIPLLFETGSENRCDVVITVSAPAFVQEPRVLNRRGMTRQRMASILARQMPDAEKRRRSDFVVLTGLGRDFSLHQIQNIVRLTHHWRGKNWPFRPLLRPSGRERKAFA